jgi:type IV pilus assembly protein PilO
MTLLPKNTRDQAMVLVTIVGLALVGLYWNFVWTPKGATLTAMQEHVDHLEAANQKAKAQLAKGSVEQLKAQAAALSSNLEVMRQLVPTGNEVPALLEQVSTAARRVDLDLAAVEPEPVIEGEQFDTFRYKVTVIGSYHEIAEFLTNVGSLTRIIAPINLQLAPLSNVSADRAKKGVTQLDTRFEIQTYVAKTAPSRRSAPAGGSKKS